LAIAPAIPTTCLAAPRAATIPVTRWCTTRCVAGRVAVLAAALSAILILASLAIAATTTATTSLPSSACSVLSTGATRRSARRVVVTLRAVLRVGPIAAILIAGFIPSVKIARRKRAFILSDVRRSVVRVHAIARLLRLTFVAVAPATSASAPTALLSTSTFTGFACIHLALCGRVRIRFSFRFRRWLRHIERRLPVRLADLVALLAGQE
jgi:hypothetical protein